MSGDAVILELATYDKKKGSFKRHKAESVIVDRITGEAVSSYDIEDLLDAGRKVFFSFGGEPVEVVKVQYTVQRLNKS